MTGDTTPHAQDDSSPRKGKSNAILTYELLADFDQKLTTIATRFDSFVDQQAARDKGYQDHETRLRLLETQITTIIATSTQSRGQWQWLWAAVIGLCALGLQALTTYSIVTHNFGH